MRTCIIVTGASRGIGKALVSELRKRGEFVIGVTRGEGVNYEEVYSGGVLTFDWESFEDLGVCLKNVLGGRKVKGLVNNAGILRKSGILDATFNDLVDHIEVNAWYPLLLFKTLYKEGLFNDEAHILNIGSMGGIQGASKFPGLFNYGASKAVLASLTESLSAEFGGEGLYFNYLGLGAVNTEMLNEAFPGYVSEVNPEKMAVWIGDVLLHSAGILGGRLIQVTKSDPKA